MQNHLISFIERLKAGRRVMSFNEAETKQEIIVRILSFLDWDIFNTDEVKPEYSVGEERVDYSLRIGDANKVFIEVKKIGEELEKHQEQLLSYSYKQGVRFSILTNGVTWWFYLPWQEGSWEQRKFYTIDILQQESEDIASKFIDFLSKGNIDSGKAVQNAEEIYKGQQRLNILKDTLPKAWNKIIEEPDELLIDLINETTERLCGYRTDTEMIEQFLSRHKNHLIIPATPPTKITLPTRPSVTHLTPRSILEGYSGKSISSFYFKGSQYRVRFWKDLLIKLCGILSNAHRAEFDKVLGLRGRKRLYFSRNKDELWDPRKIGNTNTFAETNLSANSIVKLCFSVMALFGYSTKDLRIEAN